MLHLQQSLSLLQAFFKAHALSVAEPTEQSCQEHVQQFEHSHKELESISTGEIDTSIISKLQSLEVSDYQSFLPSLLAFFRCRVSIFQAGQISQCVQQWRNLTSDSEILETVLGQRIEFTLTQVQITPPPQPTWSKTEEEFIEMEIQRLLPKGLIAHSVHEEGEFISSIFVRPKKDGSYRTILNLKSPNQYVEYHHFKLDTIWTAVHMMTPGRFTASIDLKDAYYSVHIDDLHREYLIFSWKGTLCPRKSTEPLQPVYSTLLMKGHLSVGYTDDSYLQTPEFAHCGHNIVCIQSHYLIILGLL